MVHLPGCAYFTMTWSEIQDLALDDFIALLERKRELAEGQ